MTTLTPEESARVLAASENYVHLFAASKDLRAIMKKLKSDDGQEVKAK